MANSAADITFHNPPDFSLYRQHQRLRDASITLSRSTLVYWTSCTIDLLALITGAQSADVLASEVLSPVSPRAEVVLVASAEDVDQHSLLVCEMGLYCHGQ